MAGRHLFRKALSQRWDAPHYCFFNCELKRWLFYPSSVVCRNVSTVKQFNTFFEEEETTLDAYGEVTNSSVPKISVSKASLQRKFSHKYETKDESLEITLKSKSPSRKKPFGKFKNTYSSRFSTEGLKMDESLYQLPFWEELKQKEIKEAEFLKRRNVQKTTRAALSQSKTRLIPDTKLKAVAFTDVGEDIAFLNDKFQDKPLSKMLSSINQVGIAGSIGSVDPPEAERFVGTQKETVLPSTNFELDQSNHADAASSGALADDPGTVEMMRLVIRSNNAVDVMSLVKHSLTSMPPMVLSSVVSKLSRLVTPHNRHYIVKMEDFTLCLNAIHAKLSEFNGTDLGRLFVALVKLKQTPNWMDELLRLCSRKVETMDFRHFVGCLSTVLQFSFPLKEANEFQVCLMSHAKARVASTEDADQLAKMTIALGWAKSIDPELLELIKKNIVGVVNELTGSDLANIIRTFGKLRVNDRHLGRILSDAFSRVIHDCGISEVVKVALGLAKMKVAEEDFYHLFISPSVRVFLPQMTVGEMAAITASYAESGISDTDLFYDLARHLQPHIPQLSSFELSHILYCFFDISYKDKGLYNAFKLQAMKTVETFNSACLVRVVYSLSMAGVTDGKFYDLFSEKAFEFLPTMKKFYLIRFLVALQEAECLSHPIVLDILDRLKKEDIKDLYAEECLAILTVVCSMDKSTHNTLFIQRLFSIIFQRHNTWNCLDMHSLTDLLNCMHTLQHYDQELIALILRRLHQNLVRCGMNEFLGLLNDLSSLPENACQAVRAHLHRRIELFNAFKRQLNYYKTQKVDLETEVTLIYGLARLGYESPMTQRLHDELQHKIEGDDQKLSPFLFCLLVWSMIEMKSKVDWVNSILFYFLEERYGENGIYASKSHVFSDKIGTCSHYAAAEEREEKALNAPRRSIVAYEDGSHFSKCLEAGCTKEANSLLLLAWSCIVMEEYAYLHPLLEEMAEGFGGSFPDNMTLGKQVAAHLTHFVPDILKTVSVSTTLREWVFDLSEFTFSSHVQSYKSPRKASGGSYMAFVTPYNRWINTVLNQFRVSHVVQYPIANVYTISAAFPRSKQLLDVLSFMDIKVGTTNEMVASAELRQRHLASIGWDIHTVSCKDILLAHRDNKVEQFLVTILSKFSIPVIETTASRTGEGEEKGDQLNGSSTEASGSVAMQR